MQMFGLFLLFYEVCLLLYAAFINNEKSHCIFYLNYMVYSTLLLTGKFDSTGIKCCHV